MLKIAVVDSNDAGRRRVCSMLSSLASHVTAAPFSLFEFTKVADVVTWIDAGGHFSLVISASVLSDGPGVTMIREFRLRGENTPFVMVGPAAQDAPKQFEPLIVGIVFDPTDSMEFEQTLAPVIVQISHAGSFFTVLRTVNGVARVDFDTIVFTEPDGRNQCVYLQDSSQITCVSSAAALFKKLEVDPRFFRVSASNIVNLDAIDEVAGDALRIAEPFSREIDIPRRQQKPLLAAWHARKTIAIEPAGSDSDQTEGGPSC